MKFGALNELLHKSEYLCGLTAQHNICVGSPLNTMFMWASRSTQYLCGLAAQHNVCVASPLNTIFVWASRTTQSLLMTERPHLATAPLSPIRYRF
jgi:non-ribosomal peptide synthetase component E (peptide arylation enzyme)